MPKRETQLLINDKMKIYAVVRAFEIIGEASKKIPDDVKLSTPLIEWQLMADFRNLLIHNYFGIDYQILWHSIKESLPYNYEILKGIKL